MYRIALITTLVFGSIGSAQVRIKDITDIDGARSNSLRGLGLVVGLDGTGGRSPFTQQVAVDMLQRLNVTATIFSQQPSDNVFKSANVSVVMVTAEIDPFARKGGRLDVLVSALDDARSLAGGTLLSTPLRGHDGEVYVVAEGPMSTGGFAASGQAASAQKNHLNVGRVPQGGMVEKEALGHMVRDGQVRFVLRNGDFNTARLLARAVNEHFPGLATAVDARTIAVCVPLHQACNPVGFIGELGLCEVTPDTPARIVINERTGTVVVGEHVTINPVAVAHGNLFITTSETPEVSQPQPFSERGRTVVVPRTQVNITEQKPRLSVLPKAVTVAELARSLNALGASPRDLITIFQQLKNAGALHADIIIN